MKQKVFTPLGLILLAIALLMDKFLKQSALFNFIEGLFIGLSIVLNVYSIISLKKNPESH
jgi:hypothetical protein